MPFFDDLRHAVRLLGRRPAFAGTAVLVLGLALGANAAIFALVHGVLLAPLPYPEPERLVLLWQEGADGPYEVSALNFRDWRDAARSFGGLAAVSMQQAVLTGPGPATRLTAAHVSPGFFGVLGVPPAMGRGILPHEERPGAEPTAVVSHAFWRERLGGDPSAVGRRILLDGAPVTVVGVARPETGFPAGADLWRPYALPADETRDTVYLRVLGRLAPGASIDEARSEMAALAAELERRHPDENADVGAAVEPLVDWLVGDVRTALWLLLGAVAAVLLVACVNLAGLLLARLTGRRQELAMRHVLGAGRGRLTRQLLAESLLLAAAGAAVGLLLGAWAVEALARLETVDVPRLAEVGFGGAALAYTAVLALGSALLVGLLPAVMATSRPAAALRESGRGASEGEATARLRRWLVAAQVAAALVLLTAAALLGRSLGNLLAVDPGFDPAGTLTFRVSLSRGSYPEDAEEAAFYERLASELRSLPGVESVSAVFPRPLSATYIVLDVALESAPAGPGPGPTAEVRWAAPGYFEAFRIPLLSGRTFTPADRPGAPRVAVVNRAFVRESLRGRTPLGTRLTLGDPADPEAEWWTVVGVVGDVLFDELSRSEPAPELYRPYAQAPISTAYVVVRPSVRPESLVEPIRRRLAAIDPDVPMYDVRTGAEIVAAAVARPRFVAALVGLFALAALAIAVLGVYGVLAYNVGRRTRELGVRLALGSSRRRLLWAVLGRGMRPVAAGLAVGALAALAAGRLVGSLLFGVGAADPAILAASTAALALAALAAGFVPARSATRVDPAVSLRAE